MPVSKKDKKKDADDKPKNGKKKKGSVDKSADKGDEEKGGENAEENGNGKKKKGKGKKGGGKGKSSKFSGDMLSEAAIENAYYICHNIQDLLKSRGFIWPVLQQKKKKGKGRRR